MPDPVPPNPPQGSSPPQGSAAPELHALLTRAHLSLKDALAALERATPGDIEKLQPVGGLRPGTGAEDTNININNNPPPPSPPDPPPPPPPPPDPGGGSGCIKPPVLGGGTVIDTP